MIFEAPYATGFIVLILGVAFAATFFGYRHARLSPPMNRILPAIRFTALVLLGLLLLRPTIQSTTAEEEQPVLLWLQDRSQSIVANADSAFYREGYPDFLRDAEEQLNNRYEVVVLPFDSRLQGDFAGFTGDRSNPSEAVRQAVNRYQGRNVGAVVLASDGIANMGAPLSAVQVTGSVPLFVLGMGDSAHHADLAVQRVLHNRVAYRGNVFPVAVELTAENFDGEHSEVTLYGNGKRLARTMARWNAGRSEVLFNVRADSVGLQNYTAVVGSFPGELNTVNNRIYFSVEVLEDRRKIQIVYEAPHPDIAALRIPLLEDESYEVELKTAREWNASEAGAADMVIFHGFRPGAAGYSNLLKNNVAVLAVTLSPAALESWKQLDAGWQELPRADRQADLRARPEDNFPPFRLDKTWSDLMAQAPPFRGSVHSSESNGSWIPLFTGNQGRVKTQTPIIAVTDYDNNRRAWVNGEGLWRARAFAYAETGSASAFDDGIMQLYRWLMTRPGVDRLQVDHPIRLDEGHTWPLRVTVLNAALAPQEEAMVTIKLRHPDGNLTEHVLEEGLSGQYTIEIGQLSQGAYRYTVAAEYGGDRLTKSGRFSVEPLYWEQSDTRARFDEMTALAEKNNGSFYAVEQRQELVNDLIADPRPITILHRNVQSTSLLEKWWPYVLILVLLTAEWILRKREGRV